MKNSTLLTFLLYFIIVPYGCQNQETIDPKEKIIYDLVNPSNEIAILSFLNNKSSSGRLEETYDIDMSQAVKVEDIEKKLSTIP